jgi:protein-tyrosine phosphatase
MTDPTEIRILVVCLGNICRSPMAHGVLERKLAEAGLAQHVRVDSAGTGDYHLGKQADPRARQAAAERGYELDHLRARQVDPADLTAFDLILAADRENYLDLMALAADATERERIRMLLAYGGSTREEVPDPYEGGTADFDLALDLIEDAADGVIAALNGDGGGRDVPA